MPAESFPENDVDRFEELERYSILSTSPELAFDRITKLASHFFRCPIALLSLSGRERLWFKSCFGMGFDEAATADPFSASTILRNEVTVIPDSDGPFRFYAGAPLISPRGYAIGTLCVIDTVPHLAGLSVEDGEALANLAALAMSSLQATLAAQESAKAHDLMFRDDTKRRDIERALALSENQYRATFSHAPLGLVLTELDGRFLEANEAYRRLTGYSQDELPSVKFISLTHPDEVENNRQLFQRLTQEQIPSYALEKRIIDKAGAIRWVRSHAALLRDSDGKATKVIGLVEDITDRKQAEERFRFLAESIPQMVWTATPDGLLDYVNNQGVQYFGTTEEALLGAGWLDWVHVEDQPSAIARWTESLATGDLYETEFRLRRGIDSSWRLHLVRAQALKNEAGAVTQWFGTCTDTEDRQQLAQQIEEDRRRWRTLLSQTPAAIAVLRGPSHLLEWVNPGYERLVGRASENLIGMPVVESLPEIASQVYVDLLNNVYRNGESFRGSEIFARLGPDPDDLEEFYLNFVYLPTRNAEGRIDGIFAHISDVTETVAARKAIEENERQFRILAETIPHLTWTADGAGNIGWYNRRWFDYTGTTMEEMQGWGWEKVHDPDVLPVVLLKWHAALATGKPFEMIFPLRRKDGVFQSFLTRVEPIHDSDGKVVRWFGTNTDITDQLRREEQLERINRHLEEFSYVASHDLQEPLRAVSIYTQLLISRPDASREDLVMFAGFVQSGVKRMEKLIHDLLAFSKIVHTEETATGPADLPAAWEASMNLLRARIEETGAIVTSSPLPFTRGDTSQIAHVFQNVLSNALKYCKPEVAPRIHVAAERVREHWLISIQDNGIGFEPEYAEKIFGLFKRLHTDAYSGTGMGLAICRRIIERCGGRMWAESAVEQGATFFFELPSA